MYADQLRDSWCVRIAVEHVSDVYNIKEIEQTLGNSRSVSFRFNDTK